MGTRLRAFTVIELLVVIAIIGVLLALLLPAVQSAREARAAQCLGNLKQIALAMHQYQNVHSVLPPGKKGCCWGTWLVYALPYLEQQTAVQRLELLRHQLARSAGELRPRPEVLRRRQHDRDLDPAGASISAPAT